MTPKRCRKSAATFWETCAQPSGAPAVRDRDHVRLKSTKERPMMRRTIGLRQALPQKKEPAQCGNRFRELVLGVTD